MKTIKLFWMLLLGIFTSAQAQDWDWDWATSWGGTSDDFAARSMVFGKNNDMYVSGAFRGALFTPVDTIISNGNRDALLTKLDQTTGEIIWVRSIGGPEVDVSDGLAIDSAGNLYQCGLFTSVMEVEGTTYFTNGGSDIFLAKYDTTGTLQWIKTFGGSDNEYISNLIYTRDHQLAFAGYFSGTTQLDSITFTSAGQDDPIFGKMDLDGNILWAHSFGGPDNDRFSQINEAPDGSFYCHGDMKDTFTVGNFLLESAGFSDALATKWDSEGNLLWAHSGGGINTDVIIDGTLDSAGNYYVAGYFGPEASFSGINLPHYSGQDGFIIKYQPSGAIEWTQTVNAEGGTYFYSIDYVNDDAIFFSGKMEDSTYWGNQSWTGDDETDIFYGKINSDGDLLWGAFTGGPDIEVGWRIKWKDDYAYMLGWFEDTCNLGSKQIISKGKRDGYIARRHFPFYATHIDQSLLPEFNFSAYPNPSKGDFFLDIDSQMIESADISLYDVHGREIKTWAINPTTSFPLHLQTKGIQSGIYFLTLKNHRQSFSQKIILTE